jgi:preprotein translocase subunit SecF
MFQIIQKRKIYYALSLTLVSLSIIVIAVWGIKLGIDFTGGSLMEINFGEENKIPQKQEIIEALAEFDLGGINIQQTGETGLILRFKSVDEETHQKMLTALREKISAENLEQPEEKPVLENNTETENASENPEVISEIEEIQEEKKEEVFVEERFESIGPVIGAELKRKSVWAIGLALIAIVFFVAWAFRKISRPVPSWKYGMIAIIALAHDILITLGIFAVLGHFLNVEINTPFVAALLAILGYSVNDTIVVFDRIRENLIHCSAETFEKMVNKGVNETLVRSFNTSLTTLFVLLAIFLFGGETIKYFSLTLICGVVLGTYSSIFLASPLLVSWQKWSERKK